MKDKEASALVTGAVDDAKRLVSLEAKLLKLELLSFGVRIRRTAILGSAAFGLGLNALFILTLGSTIALNAATQLSMWACCAIVGATLIVAMGACALGARQIWIRTAKEDDDGTGSRNAGT